MDNRQLLNFLTVCEEKSISKAAKRCYLTQQGLSSSMKLLEDELEVPLFNRKANGIELTEFGIALREAAVPYINQHDQIVDRIRRIKDGRSVVAVGYRTGLSPLLPENFFAGFMESYPEVMLKIHTFSGGGNCQKGMLEHNIHLGFSCELIDTVLFDSFTWHKGDIFLVVGKNHHLASRGSIRLKELKDEVIVVFNDDSYPQNVLSKLCAQNGIIPSFYLEGSEVALFIELCSTNKVVAFWEGPRDFPEWVSIEIEDFNIEWEASFIVQKNVYLNDAEKIFIEYVKNNLTIL
jgi:DNA-binding transcriptional LysR family regulator